MIFLDNPKKDKAILKKICQHPFLLLILITLGITAYILSVRIRIGVPYWDVFNYLNNALFFAGMDGGGVISYLHPLIPFLTSLFFRMGYVSINVIFIITSVIFVFGVIGFYLLLKERFTPIQSLAGSLIFISLPVVFPWVASGGIDIPGVSFSIWTVYFMVRGLKKDYRFLYLVLPFFILSFLARYTAGLIIVPLFIYLLMNIPTLKKYIKNRKFLSTIFMELLALIGALGFFFTKLGTTEAVLKLVISAMTTSPSAVDDVAYNPNNFYYLQNLINYISIWPFQDLYRHMLNPSLASASILAYIISLIVAIGLLLYVHQFLRSEKGKEKVFHLNIKSAKVILLGFLIVLTLISIYYKSFIFGEIFTGIAIYLLFRLNKDHSDCKFKFDLLFLSWFAAYLIFHSILPIKVDRYFITMVPAFVYFITLGLIEFTEKTKQIKYPQLNTTLVYLFIVLILLSSITASYTGHTQKKTFTKDIGRASAWLMEFDADYQNKIISSDYPNAVSWYLKKNVVGGFPKDYNNSQKFSNYLQKNNVEYYIDSMSRPHPDIPGYHIIKHFGVVAVYQRMYITKVK